MARNYRNLESHNGSENLTLDCLEHDLGNQLMLVWKVWYDLGNIFPRATRYNVNLS
jgi:hypothetical protein